MQDVIGPAVTEVEAAHQAGDELRRLRPAVVVFRLNEHARRAAVLLDVVDLIAEPLEANHVLQGLPDQPANRHAADDAKQYDLLFRLQVHICSISGGGKWLQS